MNTLSLLQRRDLSKQRGIPTVLIVEDETMVRLPIAEHLRDCGYVVLEAANASEAIAALECDGPVSLVFSDIRMPGKMDGIGLAEWCKSNHPEVSVLLTSGYNGGRSLPSDWVSGNHVIEKPYSQDHVATRIAALLGC